MPLIFLIGLLFFLLPTTTYSQSNGIEIVAFSPINEPEWIEIQNNGTSAVDLTNWTLSDQTHTKALAGCIGANLYRTFEVSWLNNEGDTFKLKDASGNVVDQVEYGGSTNIPTPAANMAKYLNPNTLIWEDGSSTNHQDNACTLPSNTPTNTPSVTQIPSATLTPSITSSPAPSNTPIPSNTIQITSFPSLTHIMQSFSMRFEASNLKPNTDYSFKAIGGINDIESLETFWINKWYGYTSSWDNMPKFKSDNNGKINNSISMRVKSDRPTGEYKIQIRFRPSGEDNNKDSDIKYVTIKERVPSPTDSPVPTPTPTDAPVTTPDPSELAPTIADTLISANTLGASDEIDTSPTPSPLTAIKTANSNVRSIMPIFFMVAGGLFLLIPIIVSLIKNVKKYH